MHAHKATAGVWCTFSFLIVIGSIIAFFMPYWLIKTHDGTKLTDVQDDNFKNLTLYIDENSACGMMSYCVPYSYYPPTLKANASNEIKFADEAHLQRCPLYTNFDDIPTIFGKVASVMFAAGIIILLVSWIISATTLCMDGYLCSVSTFLLISVVQLFCLIINGVAILLWTLSWDQNGFKCNGTGYCGNLSQFDTGDCELGWAFLLGLASTGSIIIAVFAGCLSFFLQKKADS